MQQSLGKLVGLKSQKGNTTILSIIICVFFVFFLFLGFLMYKHYSEKGSASTYSGAIKELYGHTEKKNSNGNVVTASVEGVSAVTSTDAGNVATNVETKAGDVSTINAASVESLRSVLDYLNESTPENYAKVQENLKIDKEQNRTIFYIPKMTEEELARLEKVQEELSKAKFGKADAAQKEHDAANLEVEKMRQAQLQAQAQAEEKEKEKEKANSVKNMLEQFKSDKFVFSESDKLTKSSVFKSDAIVTPDFAVFQFEGIGDKSKPFEGGYYAVCLQSKAYVVGGNRQTNIISVMLDGKHVQCVEGAINRQVKLIEDESLNVGVYKTCIGGFSFILLSEPGISNITQVIDEDCKPNNLEALNVLPFYNNRVLSYLSAKQIKEIF